MIKAWKIWQTKLGQSILWVDLWLLKIKFQRIATATERRKNMNKFDISKMFNKF